jgi:hypothetical protein
MDKSPSNAVLKFLVGISLIPLLFSSVFAQLTEKSLRKIIGVRTWSAEELVKLEKRQPVVRSIRTNDKQEVLTVGVLKISDLQPISMSGFRGSLKQNGRGPRKAGRRFSPEPSFDDLDGLELEKDSLDQLSKCAVAECDLNLSATAIRRFQNEVVWTAPEAEEVATRLLKEMLLDYARDYSHLGAGSIPTYDNRRKKVDVAQAHRLLLLDIPVVGELAPEFIQYLDMYPVGALENVENSLHWSVVDFGLKPSITISHVAAYTDTQSGEPQHLVASRQIYASRYLDASITFTLLLRVRRDNGSEIDTYVLFIDRSRSDALGGALGGFARRIVKKETIRRITSLLDKAHERLVVLAGQPAIELNSDLTELPADPVTATILQINSRRYTLLIGGIAFLVVLFLLLRRRPRSSPARDFGAVGPPTTSSGSVRR